jgi:hypothetical protein
MYISKIRDDISRIQFRHINHDFERTYPESNPNPDHIYISRIRLRNILNSRWHITNLISNIWSEAFKCLDHPWCTRLVNVVSGSYTSSSELGTTVGANAPPVRAASQRSSESWFALWELYQLVNFNSIFVCVSSAQTRITRKYNNSRVSIN